MTRRRRVATLGLGVVLLYLAAAYLALPWLWQRHEREALSQPGTMLTHTPQGIPGDPVNVVLVGARDELLAALAAAGWRPADPVTLRSSVEIGLSVVLDRPYPDAPVSSLLLDGRRQDLAFELPDGHSADRRHHVRLWQVGDDAADARPRWFGAASFDTGVGISHDTGQVTHHIGPNVDAERDRLVDAVASACALSERSTMPGSGASDNRRNGGGDRYVTDGLAAVGVIVPGFPEQRNCTIGGN